MRLYSVAALGLWAGTQADAKALAREHGRGWAEVEVPTDKAGLLAFLNEHEVGKPDAIARPIDHVSAAPVIDTIRPGIAPMAEDAFEALPLAMQLHLAALALENARRRIPS